MSDWCSKQFLSKVIETHARTIGALTRERDLTKPELNDCDGNGRAE